MSSTIQSPDPSRSQASSQASTDNAADTQGAEEARRAAEQEALRAMQEAARRIAEENARRAAEEAARSSFEESSHAPVALNSAPSTSPSSAVPQTDLERGESGPEVEKLQHALVQLGYMTEQQVRTGPGVFGPQTEAALKRFQTEHGVPSTGTYGPQTRKALSSEVGTGVAEALPAAGAAGATASGPALSAREAFITQFTSDYNPTGPSGSTNCGPASLAMCLAYSGHMPEGLNKEQQVDYARALMSPQRKAQFTYVQAADGSRVPQLDRDRELTGGTMVSDGVRAAGLTPRYQQGWEALDQQLAAGQPVIANGYTNAAWRDQFPERMGRGDIGHLNAILGKTPEGKYLVADPLHTGGPVAMTRQQLGVFFSPTGGVPSFTALEGAGGANTPARSEGGLSGVLPSLTQPGVATVGMPSVGGPQSAELQAVVSADVKRLEQASQQGLLQGAREFERLVNSNADPAYREALAEAARPVLEELGDMYARPSPEIERLFNPPPPLRKPDKVDPQELNRLSMQDRQTKLDTYFTLARATELLGDRGAVAVGESFARRMPEGISQSPRPLGEAVKTAVEGGVGTRLALELARGLNTPPPGGTHARGGDTVQLMSITGAAIDKVRTDFTAVADRVKAHNEKLVQLLAGPHALLTPDQRNAVVTAWRNSPPQNADFDAFERQGQRLASIMPGVSAAGSSHGPSLARDFVNREALANELPRLAETRAGAAFISQEIEKTADKKPSFLQWTVESIAGRKDAKDFTDKLSQAIAQSVGLGVLGRLGGKNLDGAAKLLSGLEHYAPVFGIEQGKMKAFVDQLRRFHPNMPLKQAQAEAAKLDGLLGNLEPGTPGAPDTVPGQALRGLGFIIGTAAVIDGASKIDQNGTANNLKLLGDVLSLGADGAALGASVLSKSAFFAAANNAGKFFGPLGTGLGAAGDALIAIQEFKKKEWLAGAAATSQFLGGGIMAAAALLGAGPGTQLLGAGLFLVGLVAKGVDGHLKGEELKDEQVAMLTLLGPPGPDGQRRPIMDPTVARALVEAGPQHLTEQLVGKGKMSVEQVQVFLRDYGPVAEQVGGLEVLTQTAGYYRMEGANLPRFLEHLAFERNGLSEAQGRQVDAATRAQWMNDVALDLVRLEQEAKNHATVQRQSDQSKSRETFIQEYMRGSLSEKYPKSTEWAVSQRHRQQ
jgi:peptidoglycan hydrolase-like protein with peptidoglycan-binding domain